VRAEQHGPSGKGRAVRDRERWRSGSRVSCPRRGARGVSLRLGR
jgi:hypothetical protein